MSHNHVEKQPAQTRHAKDAVMENVFRQDPSYAVALLNNLVEQGDWDELVIALNQLTKAFGAWADVLDLNPNELSCTPPESNTTLRSVTFQQGSKQWNCD